MIDLDLEIDRKRERIIESKTDDDDDEFLLTTSRQGAHEQGEKLPH